VIKGYVTYLNRKVPITWERETKKYVYNVRKVYVKDNSIIKDKRLYDEKVAKKEIFFKMANG
jgi:hypothetical protein